MTKQLNRQPASHLNRYRWQVFCRCCLAIVGGYLIANLSIPVITLLTPQRLALATYSALLLSFVLWLIAIMAIFSMKTLKKATLLTAGTLLFMTIAMLLLKWWRL